MDERQELEDEYMARTYGDPRRCPVHGIATSSPCGMFDAPCGACEAESDQDEWERENETDLPSDAFEDWRDDAGAEEMPFDDTPF